MAQAHGSEHRAVHRASARFALVSPGQLCLSPRALTFTFAMLPDDVIVTLIPCHPRSETIQIDPATTGRKA